MEIKEVHQTEDLAVRQVTFMGLAYPLERCPAGLHPMLPRCLLLAKSGLSGHVAGMSALLPTADILDKAGNVSD